MLERMFQKGEKRLETSRTMWKEEAVKTAQNVRLMAARAALRVVEDQQGMRSYAMGSEFTEAFSFGVYHVGWNPATLVEAIRQASGTEGWVALLAVNNLGWEAAAKRGVELKKMLLVDCPQEQVAVVVSLLLESVETVVVGNVPVSFAQQRSLLARSRKLGRTILLSAPWPSISQPWRRTASRMEVAAPFETAV